MLFHEDGLHPLIHLGTLSTGIISIHYVNIILTTIKGPQRMKVMGSELWDMAIVLELDLYDNSRPILAFA